MLIVRLGSLGAALLLAAGCGSDDPDPSPPAEGTAEEQIATTVNAMFEAWNEGDGELACAYMTTRGQRFAASIANELHSLEQEIDPGDCVSAIEETAAATGEEIGEPISPSAVTVTGQRGSVASSYRGALAVRRVDGTWLVEMPTFID